MYPGVQGRLFFSSPHAVVSYRMHALCVSLSHNY